MRSKISCRPSLRRPLTVSAFSNALEFRKSSALMQNFICLTVAVVDEILPLAASRARYLLATHARHSPYPLAASRRFTNVHRCRLSPASSRIFLRLASCASPHLRQDRAVPLKHANLSCIKFRFFAVLAACHTLPRRLLRTVAAPYPLPALSESFSACALKFQPKTLFSAASKHKQSHRLFGDAG